MANPKTMLSYAFMEGGHKKLAFFGLNMTKT